jgi:ABC-type multidrug transport system fused ATPase/permease subunit
LLIAPLPATSNALAARKQVAEARSPLFSILGDTTSGVVTIRAFKRARHFASTYLAQTDRYNQVGLRGPLCRARLTPSSSSQMQLYEDGLDRWLEERSDIVGATVSFIVGLLALRAGIDSGTTGFLVSTGLEFTSRILYVVRAINKNELSLNSVQRILAYTDVEQEVPDSEKGKPPASWPQGRIEVSRRPCSW